MTVDEKLDHAADKLHELSARAASHGGMQAKLAQPLADDAAFLRKLKPSLIRARARGELPTNEPPGHARVAPAGPQLGRPPKPRRTGGKVSPLLVVGAALAAGVLLAKWIDWRGHAHPRR